MKKILMLLVALVALSGTAAAQESKITGTVKDKDTGEPLSMVTVQLYRNDTTYVKGAITADDGTFAAGGLTDGRYTVRLSSVGYKTQTVAVNVAKSAEKSIGTVQLKADAIMLKGTTVDGHAAKVVLKEDTFVYNAAAYRVPEGSVIEELVKRLPGAQVSDDGKITINGKEVKKVMVDGKEFMTGDTQTALKNLPTSIVERVKAYDKKSDLARITGIDDGEEETVLDFGLKKGMNKGFMSNVDVAYGTHDRYAERLMAGYFNDKTRVMLFGNANNTNDMGFPGGGGGGRFGGSMQGLNAMKMIGANINYDNGKTLQLDGSIRWNHSDGDRHSVSSSENFVSTVGSFSNSISQSYTRSNSWDGRLRLEWKPDTMTNVMFRPSFSMSSSDGNSQNLSASYNEDPYTYVSDPLDDESIDLMKADSIVVNRSRSRSVSYSDSKNVNLMLQLNRKLNSRGRNVTLRADMGYSDGESKSISMSEVDLYLMRDANGNPIDSAYQTNRYNTTPTKKWDYTLRATYSEPIAKGLFAQVGYRYKYSYSKSDRSTYDFGNMGDVLGTVSTKYRNWDGYLSHLENPLDDYRDISLSRYSEYRNYIHQVDLSLRLIRSKYQLNVGAMIQPQRSKFIQDYQGVYVDTTRTVTNFSPTLDFRYRFNKQSNLRLNYRGTTSQPSMTDLLDITDDSDPLNISKGNPGLKPSFTNNLRFFYNTYLQKRQQAIMTYLNYSNTRNSISTMVTYDEVTGGRTTRPENINGNWNVDGGFMYNTAIDTTGYFNVNTFTNVGYNNYVSYLSLGNASSQKNTTRTTTIGERIGASYRNSWLEIELNGSLNYSHTRNLLQSQNNMDTWQFAYGTNIGVTMPWGTGISVDLHENSRRGYNDAAMNTNELIWNAQISQSFLKGKPLTVSLQLYDILHEQSNFSRTINSMMRSDTQYNSINSYAMLHVSYRFNAFGGKEARRGDRGPGFGGPGRDGGRPPRGGMMIPMGGGRMPRG